MTRIKLIQSKDALAAEHGALFDDIAALRGRVSGPSSVMLHSPRLARPWNDVGEYLHLNSVVEAEHAELAVIATAREFDCDYIWNAHVSLALKAGVSEQTVEAVRKSLPLEGLPASEALTARFARQLLQDKRVESGVFEQLLQAHGARWLLELTMWIGRYSSLACILDAFEVPAAPEAEHLTLRPSKSHVVPAWPQPKQRIAGITTRDEVPEIDRAVFDTVAEGRGNVRGPFALLMHSPQLCSAILNVSNYLRFDSLLTPRLRELAVIATAREMDCPYVWAAHAPAARAAGIADATVVTIRDRSGLDALTSEERDIVEYVRQLLRTRRVPQALFESLRDSHDEVWMVEMTALVGHYVLTCDLLSAVEVSPAPEAERLPL